MSTVSRERLRDTDRATGRDLTTARPQAGGTVCTLGADPGGTLGLFLGTWSRSSRKLTGYRSWQCEQGGALELTGWVLGGWGHLIQAAGIEEFRTGPRATRLKGVSGAAVTAQLHGIETLIEAAGIQVRVRPAATIKTWATDARLKAAGVLEATSGMPAHARDAGRVCLYTACADLGMRDPLSRART